MPKGIEWSPARKALLIFSFFIVVTIVLTSFFGRRGVMEIYRYKDEIRNLEVRIANLEREKKRLEIEIRELENNEMAVEPIARQELWYMKEGEVVVLLRHPGGGS